ncbi:MAG: amino acid ABC transporter permease [Ancalomicrobiaceae bacterium]|nr:amino acid ABC transporter permease [Ancalomicrobiaceae bacterium]
MDWSDIIPYLPDLARGFLKSIEIALLSAATALVTALLLTLASATGNAIVRAIVAAYTEIILGLPILVLLYVIYFVLPKFGVRFDETTAGVLTLTLYYSPYLAEAIRGAVAAVPVGQVEAARMIGLGELSILARIVVPQALALMIPSATGILIGLVKDTAILSVISVEEFAYVTKQVVSHTYAPFETWTLVAAVYWVTLALFETLMRGLERRLSRFRPKVEFH